ncbi:MAG: hypothetical protein QXH80_00645 [Candidatus Nanoarchaeia archaeon]
MEKQFEGMNLEQIMAKLKKERRLSFSQSEELHKMLVNIDVKPDDAQYSFARGVATYVIAFYKTYLKEFVDAEGVSKVGAASYLIGNRAAINGKINRLKAKYSEPHTSSHADK